MRNVIRPRSGTVPGLPLGMCRGLGAALAAVLAISPLLGALHDASVRHIACPDDGDLIELPAQGEQPHRHASATAAAALFPEAPLAPDSPGTGHDHCVIASLLRSPVGASTWQPDAIAPPRALAPSAQPPEQSVAPGLALYKLVPKASPPA